MEIIAVHKLNVIQNGISLEVLSWDLVLGKFFMLLSTFYPCSQNSSTSGLVLEDFDATFANQFYQSHLDDLCEFIYVVYTLPMLTV